MIFTILEYAVMTTAVIGVYLNNHKIFLCFPIWLISNAMAGLVHWHGAMTGMLLRDAIFMLLAVHGWRQWRRYEIESR